MQTRRFHRQPWTLAIVVFWLAILVGVYANQQQIIDWWKLRGYSPPAQISSLAVEDTMTASARHLFYVNKPVIATGQTFTHNCPEGAEKTVVLGCYISDDRGIYLYQVTDSRLDGVVQVTAAHEMLHAAYERLSTAERNRIDSLLKQYYQYGLTDSRVKATIDAYKKSEPSELSNEMHSVFGTEVVSLPSELETYYARYFTDRRQVTGYTARYQQEFTSRQNQVARYDVQLTALKQSIENHETKLAALRSDIETQQNKLEALQAAQSYGAYNLSVSGYNQAVRQYNDLLNQTKAEIERYNVLVDTRNSVALEEQQLVQALSSQSLPGAQ